MKERKNNLYLLSVSAAVEKLTIYHICHPSGFYLSNLKVPKIFILNVCKLMYIFFFFQE